MTLRLFAEIADLNLTEATYIRMPSIKGRILFLAAELVRRVYVQY